MIGPIKISPTEDGIRLGRWFMRHYPKLSIGSLRKLCRTGQIRVNAGRIRGNEILYTGDLIRIPPQVNLMRGQDIQKTEGGHKFSMADLEKLRKRIIHDDSDIVVFDKPAGLAVQGGTGIKKSLDKMAAAMFPHDNILLVHRLDRETSGVIVVAKNQNAAKFLAEEFRTMGVHKEYLALLSGPVKPKRGTINNFIAKGVVLDKEEAEVFRAESGIRPQNAITRYNVLGAVDDDLTFVSFVPETGRTHQLRIHSAYSLGAPIVGDKIYGAQKGDDKFHAIIQSDNLFLFAKRIVFRHPSGGEEITISAPMPQFMKQLIDLLGLNAKE